MLTVLFVILGFAVVGQDAFTFPSDWRKIRQAMLRRRRMESSLTIRFFPGAGSKDFGDMDYDDILGEEDVTKPPPRPIKIDPIMLEVMKIANFTEIQSRFNATELEVRSAFGLQPNTPQPFRGSDAVWNLTRALVRSGLYEAGTGNALFSPISILTTLNLLLLATSGETNQQLRQTLGYPRYTGVVHSQFQQIIKSMKNEIGVTLSSSNAIFTQVNFPISEQYKKELNYYYGSQVDIIPLDFTRRPQTTMRLMNRFISSRTNNLIRNMFTEPAAADSKVVMSNALYFNGSWEYEFLFDPPHFIGIETEFNSFRKKINLTLMTANIDFPYLADPDLGFKIASLPYEHDVRNEEISEAHMFLILPNQPGEEAFLEVENRLTTLDWEDVFQRMQPVYGEFLLPRIKMEFQTNLAATLANLGLKKLFSGRGSRDFSPLTDQWDKFKMDTLQHKTVLKITEKGTEAAASTSAFQFRMLPSLQYKLDRPFFLFIYDALNKVVIFWSRVVEPKPNKLFTKLIPNN